jgi:hypothetical protein
VAADAVLPPDLVDGAPGVGLLQDRHDLGLGELRLPHGNLLAKGGYFARMFSLWLSTIAGSLQEDFGIRTLETDHVSQPRTTRDFLEGLEHMPAGTLKVLEKAIHDFSCFGKAWMGSAAALF